ncbi:MAG: ScpA family protein [Rhodospirillales bacterium]|nr:ScpA family protein [Rhodospirillales bacterium]
MTDDLDTKISEFEDEEGGAVSVPEDKKLVVDVEGFEGPIDVLLSLARNQKVDLTQISILELADQYLLWVAKIRQSNLELAADYLVMAAWLAYLKSRLLLPDLSQEEEPSGEEMAAALQFQLRRLEAMQQTGSALMDLNRLGQDFFARGEPERFGYNSQTTYDIDLFELLNAYGDHTHRSNIRTLHIQPSDLYSPTDAVKWLKNMVGAMPDWQDLSHFLPEKLKGDIVSRSMLASAFVAALQLTKEGQIQIQQREVFGPIMIRSAQQSAYPGPAQTQQQGPRPVE